MSIGDKMPTVTIFLVAFAIAVLLLLFWIHKCTINKWLNAQNIRTRTPPATNNGVNRAIFVISQQKKTEYDPTKDLPPTYSEVTANPSKYKEMTWEKV